MRTVASKLKLWFGNGALAQSRRRLESRLPCPLTAEQLNRIAGDRWEWRKATPPRENGYERLVDAARDFHLAEDVRVFLPRANRELLSPKVSDEIIDRASSIVRANETVLDQLESVSRTRYWQWLAPDDRGAFKEAELANSACHLLLMRARLSAMAGDAAQVALDCRTVDSIARHAVGTGVLIHSMIGLMAALRLRKLQLVGIHEGQPVELARPESTAIQEWIFREVSAAISHELSHIYERLSHPSSLRLLVEGFAGTALETRSFALQWLAASHPEPLKMQATAESIVAIQERISHSEVVGPADAFPHQNAVARLHEGWPSQLVDPLNTRLTMRSLMAAKRSLHFHENPLGNFYLASLHLGIARSIDTAQAVVACEQALAMVGAYKRLGSRIARLEELVELGALESLPVDAYTGEPWRFIPEVQRIWSPGPSDSARPLNQALGPYTFQL